MKKTRIVVTTTKRENYNGDLLIYCIEQMEDKKIYQDDTILSFFKMGCELGDFSGKIGESLSLYPTTSIMAKTIKSKRVAIIGVGSTTNKKDELYEQLRKAGGNIALLAKKLNSSKIMLSPPEFKGSDRYQAIECLLEGILLGDYRFEKYKSKDKDNTPYIGLKEVKIFTKKNPAALRKIVKSAEISAHATRSARDMANEPGNGWTPQEFEDYAKKLESLYPLQCKIIEKREMKRLGMGGILAVNQGSSIAPKMIVLQHKAGKKYKTILLVGKGLTFDSGGVSLKPANGMQDMKYDMCGGAAVLSVMEAVGQEKPLVNIIAIVPSTDNMSGGGALKPGDIISHYNSVTSEIINTDAEGRLILADALAYGIEKYNPDCVIDLATLTGAVIIGLGHHHTGVIGNNEELEETIVAAGKRCGEPHWRLPLNKDYSKQIESKVADIKNTGGKAGGTITAAAYLQKFVGDTPWAHLDIAGTAWNFTEKSYVPKGPSGIGVRTLVTMIRTLSEEEQIKK